MKSALFSLVLLPFLAGAAYAADPLDDGEMDKVTAGAVPNFALRLSLIDTGDGPVPRLPGSMLDLDYNLLTRQFDHQQLFSLARQGPEIY